MPSRRERNINVSPAHRVKTTLIRHSLALNPNSAVAGLDFPIAFSRGTSWRLSPSSGTTARLQTGSTSRS